MYCKFNIVSGEGGPQISCHSASLSGPCPLFFCSALAIFRASTVSRRLSIVFFCVRGRRSAPSLCLRAKTLERLALLSPHTCATWGLETPAFAQTCETCETWPELVLKLVGICVKLVKLVKLGRKITLTYFSAKFHEFHEFHANTNKFQDELFPSFTSFTCLGCFGRQTQPCCNCSPQTSRVDCPSFFGVRGRRSAPSLCLRAKTLERLALLSPHTCATWGLETPAFAQTCETCETWPELVLKLVGICVKLVKLVKLGRKITLTYFSSKFHEFHKFHANTNKFQDELFPSFTSFTCLGCFGRQTQPCCNCSPQTSRVDCPSFFCVRGRRSAPSLCLRAKTLERLALLSPHTCATWGLETPAFAQTCETCETWPELVLKLVGICVKLVKLVKLGRKITLTYFSFKFHEFHEFHANTNKFQDELFPSFTSFTCLGCFGRQTQPCCNCSPQTSRVDCPSFFCVRGRRSAPSLCLRAKTLERLALLSPHTCATWGLETPAFAQTCETCETWPELVLKLVGICVKLVKLVKLGRKITLTYFSSKFHEFHEFHANTNKFQDELFPSFTSFTCLGCFGRQTQPCCNCSPQTSRVDCPSFFCVRGRRSAPSLCLRAKTLERLALLSPYTCATWGLETPAFAQTCETCETWPELVLKLVGICVKLVKLVKLGRKITLTYFSSKFHEIHEFHANTLGQNSC